MAFPKTQALGCGWIATYNAAKMLGLSPISPEEIIREFEMNGLLAYGCWGLHPLAIARFFIKRGYNVTISVNNEEYDGLVTSSNANILFYTKGANNSFGSHYFALKKSAELSTSDNPVYLAYNKVTDYNDIDYIETSLSSFVNGKQSILFSITPKEES